MAEVFEPVIEIKTGDSEQTVKGLKKEISDLRDAILNLEKGSDAYNDAVEKLQADQRKLNEVMELTKKEATALDGSYDALTHQMAQLKKEWKATNDEAKRGELGKQIDEINQQLKEMDASVGNFQRNVGNYVSHWEGMPEVTKDFGASMAEMNQQIEPTKQKFESVGKIASGLASGFAVVQGSMALLGVESEDLEKTFVKLQAAMAIMQGVKGIGDLVEGVGKAKVAFADLGTEVKDVSKAMGKSGWLAIIILVVTAIVALVAHIKKKNEAIKDGTSALKEYNKVGKESVVNTAEEVLKLELLQRITTDTTRAIDDRRKAAEKLLTTLGKEITETNILAAMNGDLEGSITEATKAMIKQAMVAGQMEKLTELYKEYLTIQAEGATAWKDFVPPWLKMVSGGIGGAAEWIFGGIDEAGENFNERLTDAETAYKEFAKAILENADADDLIKALFGDTSNGEDNGKEALEKRIAGYVDSLKSAKQKLNEWYEKELAEAEKYGVDTTAITQKYQAELKRINDLEAAASGKEVDAEKEKAKALLDTTDDYFKTKKQLLEAKYQEELALLEKYGLDSTNLTKKYQQDLASLELKDQVNAKEIAMRKELNQTILLEDEERQKKEYEIRQRFNEEKLALLKKSLEETQFSAEQKEQIAIELANLEIQIEREKYAEEKRLRDKDAEEHKKAEEEKTRKEKEEADKRKETANKLISVTQAGLSATKDILDKVAEGYETDGEISEEEAKKLKAIRYSTTVIDMMQGIVSALASAAGMGPAGWIAGGIQAAAIATTGIMSLTEISKQDFNSMNNSPIATTAVNPSASAYASVPFDAVRNITGVQETEQLNQATKVYVLESDISNAMNKAQIRESEASF